MAFMLAGVAAWLLGWSAVACRTSFAREPQDARVRVSRVRSAMIEMELDHDTGALTGTVLAGALAGRRLDDLDKAALQRALPRMRATDLDGVRLLEAYLDRRFPGWREHAQRDTRSADAHACAIGRDDGRGSLPDPGASAGREPRRDPRGASRR